MAESVATALICNGWLMTAMIFGVMWGERTWWLVRICARVLVVMLQGLEIFIYWWHR